MSVASSCVRERAHHHGAPVVVPSADADAEEARDHHHHARRASSFSFSRPPREGGGSRPLVAFLALAAVLALALVHHAVRRRDPSAASNPLASALRARLGASARLSLELREVFFLPFLRATVGFAAFLSALVAADRLFHFYVTTYWRVFRRADPPHRRWRLDPTPLPPTAKVTPSTIRRFPAVVVQLPMFNEKAVCRHVIDAACALDWPRSKLRVQILDDSTCEETKSVIDDAAFHWRERGVDVVVRRRATREGYKAGAMRDSVAGRRRVRGAVRRLRRRLRPRARVLTPDGAVFRTERKGGVRPGEVDVRERAREHAHARAGDFPELSHPVRAVRKARRGFILQLQRHRRGVARGVRRRRGRVG